MHPKCFDMYKRMSLHRWDKVDIDGLWLLREVSFSTVTLSRPIDTRLGSRRLHQSVHGLPSQL